MSKPPYVRLMRLNELNQAAVLCQRAFREDTIQNFFAKLPELMTLEEKHTLQRKNQENFFKFMLRASMKAGSRVTVAVLPEGDSERIVATTIWRPPRTDIPLSNIIFIIRSGILPVVRAWGLSVFSRVSAVVQATNTTLSDGYKEWGLEGTPEDSWCLELAGTDPEFQNRGYMSMLMREAFKHAPSAHFTLEASTPQNRDKYEHFGFKVVRPVTIGENLVNSQGCFINAEPDMKKGFPIYPMIKKPESS